MEHRPLFYVCLVSYHNVAEAQAMGTLRPKLTWLVASSRMLAPADKLRRWAGDQRTLNVEVVGTGLAGDGIAETLAWATTELLPEVERRRSDGWRCVLNATGGTKAMVLALRQAAPWQEIHYSPVGKLICERVDTELRSVGQHDLDALSPVDQARLYVPEVEAEPPAVSASQALLDRLYEQWQDDTSPFRRLSKVRAAIEGRGDGIELADKRRRATEVAGALEQGAHPRFAWVPVDEEVAALARELFALDTTRAFQVEAQRLLMPCVDPGHLESAHGKYFAKWVSGLWFEDVVASWFEKKLSANHVVKNLKYRLGKEAGQELDVVCQVKGQLRIAEVKCGPQPFQRLSTLTDKLVSVAHALGMVKRAFVTTPDFASTHSQQQRDQWKLVLAEKDIAWLMSPEAVAEWLSK